MSSDSQLAAEAAVMKAALAAAGAPVSVLADAELIAEYSEDNRPVFWATQLTSGLSPSLPGDGLRIEILGRNSQFPVTSEPVIRATLLKGSSALAVFDFPVFDVSSLLLTVDALVKNELQRERAQ